MPKAELFARIDAVDAATVKAVANRFILDQDVAISAMGDTQVGGWVGAGARAAAGLRDWRLCFRVSGAGRTCGYRCPGGTTTAGFVELERRSRPPGSIF
jgi:hypothetical protein